MKLNKILSAAMLVVMLFTTVAAVAPIKASAAYTPSSNLTAGNELENESAVEKYLEAYLSQNENSAAEYLQKQIAEGYLYSVNSSDNKYTVYVNKYTGFFFYKNNVTGQILTSNPINPGYGTVDEFSRQELMSQISISFFESSNSSVSYNYNSYRWAALRSQVYVNHIAGGLRVNYTLGDTTERFLLPGYISAVDFETDILIPILEQYKELAIEHLGEYCEDEDISLDKLSFFNNGDFEPYEDYGSAEYGAIRKNSIREYDKYLKRILSDSKLPITHPGRKALETISKDLNTLVEAYNLKAPSRYIIDIANKGADKAQSQVKTLEKMYKDYPVTKPKTNAPDDYGMAIYVCGVGADDHVNKRRYSAIITKYIPTYTYAMMFEDEAECGYKDQSKVKPVFKCALEYTFSEDGSLSVRLPANSISFDETVFTLSSITPLKYFGAGDMANEGYMFFPDGSGTVIRFDDFYNEANNKRIPVTLESDIYGNDYCYSTITGAHRAQITMPVYGVVADTNYGDGTKVTNGYFAIIEDGASMATLSIYSGGSVHRFATTFSSYNPFPSDEYDLSETISVGSLGKYFIVSDSRYTGSYVTRYTMLTDERIGDAMYGENNYYKSSYVGMAAYYRDYLKANGTLEALELVSEDIPLYIESLGSMQILDKFLTFPVNKNIPLTTFDDLKEMYLELSKCSEYVKTKAEEYRALAAEEKDAGQKYQYEKKAKQYEDLMSNYVIENIDNINFKLTGYANGGMSFTYPVKSRWDSVVGGKRGFIQLANLSKESSKNGVNFGIFPEFDFMYINNTSLFDGIGNKGNVSQMVDNRYASKQVYNAIKQEYETGESSLSNKIRTLVISSDALDRLFSKFERDYSRYDFNRISVSTLGSDLNSNFDEDNPINRDDAQKDVCDLLDRMANINRYEVMIDKGNIYAVKYAKHILNMSIDSSHFRYSSFAVPFVGLVLHSYVNYTGAPINYSGSIEYDLLRSIENGASLYFILCAQNTSYMKDDNNLSKYYGVDYENWYASVLEIYTRLNKELGLLQDYEIVDHRVLIAERIIEEHEMEANYVRLQDEILESLEKTILKKINATYDKMMADGAGQDKRVKFDITDDDMARILTQISEILNKTTDELGSDFVDKINGIEQKFIAEYPGAEDDADSVNVSVSGFEYESKYSYLTDSFATDKRSEYAYTDYTNDNGNVVMVTYKKGDDVVKFILNYNIFTVNVRLDADTECEIGKYGYVRID